MIDDRSLAPRSRRANALGARRRLALSVVLVAPYGVFVPLHARAGPVRDHEEAVFEVKWRGEDWVGPILPFQPMSGFRHTHQVRRELGIEMRRHLDTCGASYRRCAHPARHATDTHQIGHNIVSGAN